MLLQSNSNAKRDKKSSTTGNQNSNDETARNYINLLFNDSGEIDISDNNDNIQLPDWYDKELFTRAQKFYHENQFAMFVGKLAGLLAVLAIPSILKLLVFTKESGTAMTAYRRYLATIFHTMSWYDHELTPGSKSWASLEAVRKRHTFSSKVAKNANVGYINQRNMVLTQFGFMGFILIKPHKLGVQVSHENFEAFVHFWRVIGHMIGIQDSLNLCTDSWETTRNRLEIILNEVYRPSLENTTDEFEYMCTVLIDGLWCFNPFLRPNVFIYFTKMIADCHGYVYLGSDMKMINEKTIKNGTLTKIELMNWYSRLVLFLQYSMHHFWINFPIVRWYMNFQLVISTWIIYYIPFLAIFMFGFKKAYVRILNGYDPKNKTKCT